jgi:hypothetical protein
MGNDDVEFDIIDNFVVHLCLTHWLFSETINHRYWEHFINYCQLISDHNLIH